MIGIPSFDYNGKTILCLSDVESVSHALSINRKTLFWKKNIIDREIELTGQCFFVFRLNGYKWTHIIARDCYFEDSIVSVSEGFNVERKNIQEEIENAQKIELNKSDAIYISKVLDTRTIFYKISDTVSMLSFSLYDRGNLLQQFNSIEGYVLNHFISNLPEYTIDKLKDVRELANQMFERLNALEIGWNFTHMVGYIMHEPGHKIIKRDPDRIFERIDFLSL